MSAIEELASGWEEAWSGRDPRAFEAICAPDAHYEDPLTASPLFGPEGVARHAQRLWRAFPDVLMRRSGEPLGDGSFVAFAVEVLGTNAGPLDTLPASGNFVSTHAVFYCELDGARERIWRARGFYDSYAIGVALGVLPKHGSLRQRGLLMLQGYGLRLGR
jgi:steroid delta-isomerase-like uncharacterized protein